jgi:hypothetical protein
VQIAISLPGIDVCANIVEEVVDEDGLVQAVLNDVVPQLYVVMLWDNQKAYVNQQFIGRAK